MSNSKIVVLVSNLLAALGQLFKLIVPIIANSFWLPPQSIVAVLDFASELPRSGTAVMHSATNAAFCASTCTSAVDLVCAEICVPYHQLFLVSGLPLCVQYQRCS